MPLSVGLPGRTLDGMSATAHTPTPAETQVEQTPAPPVQEPPIRGSRMASILIGNDPYEHGSVCRPTIRPTPMGSTR